MFNQDEFYKYAVKHRGISSATLHNYTSITSDYISPTIIEERQLNVAQMDVFSRLMMDRIIFLGAGINDYVANIVQAQLLFLESVDAFYRRANLSLLRTPEWYAKKSTIA
jgi:ATP-dependent Clp protease protease subunit